MCGESAYFGTQSLTEYSTATRFEGELCTAMLDRAMDLARQSGQVAFVAVRNWLYVSQLSAFRGNVFRTFPLRVPPTLGSVGLSPSRASKWSW